MSEEDDKPKLPTAKEFGHLLQDTMAMLAIGIKDGSPIKNYLEMTFTWDDGILPDMPFRRVALTFYRDGGKSPHEARKEAERDLENADAIIAKVTRGAFEERAKFEERIRVLEAELADLKERDLDHDR